ncbi:MAG: MGH1-like glycoside hydrolase domain-containing protein, partial [Limisphaerales bacterium]
HGSPVPVQSYLFWELWNRTPSLELLAYCYPRLRQNHACLAGRLGSSTTRRHRDHLICTWDYFYNSGGWDDYPPQKYVHAHHLEASVAPVVNSAHTIRSAKLLRAAAAALQRPADFAEYDKDVAVLSASLHACSWDEASGYFGYVTHDAQGKPAGILRHDSGANFNMGLDGAYPLVAGICSPSQERQILDRLFSPQHLWMDIGLTTVDQSAPYFSPTGYWNGSVWLAHQWFFWKTMLDLGRGDLALQIARTGLDLWKKVTDATYDCMEHFEPREPFGAGWGQFSSLSSPALSWFASLYTPGRFTCGFDLWIEHCEFSRNNRSLRAKLKRLNGADRNSTVLACMNPDSRYRVLWNGVSIAATCHEHCLQIQLPPTPGELRIDPIE